MRCDACFHHCQLEQGQVGFCRGRMNKKGKIVSLNANRFTSMALDPIEKKPFSRFHSGSMILSVGGFGCNLRCPFCQNHSISMADSNVDTITYSPKELVSIAKSYQDRGNIGVAFTYNEPLINYEYILETAHLLHQEEMVCVVVSNGVMGPHLFEKVIPSIDAINIDLKGFTSDFYSWVQGDLECVKKNIEIANRYCHVELTTLIIPDKNDSKEQMQQQASWIAGINPNIPLHISRFFPRYKYTDTNPTDVNRIYELVDVAKEYLKYVYRGNC